MSSSSPHRLSPPRSDHRALQAVAALVVVVVAVFAAVTLQRLASPSAATGSGAPGASGSLVAAASAAPGLSASAAPGLAASAAPSSAASAAPSPAAPILEAEMPRSVDGVTLTVESATDATSLSSDPSGRALDAAMTSLGRKPSDLEIAIAYDAAGSLDLSVLGFRVAGVDPATLRPLVLDTWLAAGTPGVTTTTASLSGIAATKVSYGDGGPDAYLFVRGDSVFLVETSDASIAAKAVGAMPATTSGAPSATPAGSPSPS